QVANKKQSSSKRRQARVVKQESASKSRQARIDKQESISKNEIKAAEGRSKRHASEASLVEQEDIKARRLQHKYGGVESVSVALEVAFNEMEEDRVEIIKIMGAVHIRGEEDEESGLFIIRSDSQTQIGLAHTVAFEDHGETMNFCYLLESFFEDLEDFNTNIQGYK
ncbi:hypothetical protein Tco_0343118, partial [Tanacetum coccineum]